MAATDLATTPASAPSRRRSVVWWVIRFVLYYTAFELLAPFAAFFGGRPGRIAEGVVFGVLLASIHPWLRGRIGRRHG